MELYGTVKSVREGGALGLLQAPVGKQLLGSMLANPITGSVTGQDIAGLLDNGRQLGIFHLGRTGEAITSAAAQGSSLPAGVQQFMALRTQSRGAGARRGIDQQRRRAEPRPRPLARGRAGGGARSARRGALPRERRRSVQQGRAVSHAGAAWTLREENKGHDMPRYEHPDVSFDVPATGRIDRWPPSAPPRPWQEGRAQRRLDPRQARAGREPGKLRRSQPGGAGAAPREVHPPEALGHHRERAARRRAALHLEGRRRPHRSAPDHVRDGQTPRPEHHLHRAEGGRRRYGRHHDSSPRLRCESPACAATARAEGHDTARGSPAR